MDVRSCAAKSGAGLETGGEVDADVMETVLSEGAKGLEARWRTAEAVGGARPLPLPRTRPPPSFRPDMAKTGERLAVISC